MSNTNPKPTAKTIQQALTLAVQHHQAGRFTEAEAIYREILAQQPDNADALHLLGVIAHQMNKQQTAMELIGRAIAINPREAVYHNSLGLVLGRLGRPDQAIMAHQSAVKLKPDFAEANYNLGVALGTRRQLPEAAAAYSATIRFKPDFPDAYLNLGNALQDMGKIDEAIGVYRTAIQIKPDHAELHNNLGNLLRDQGKSDEAVGEYLLAMKYRPDLSQIHSNLGNALRDQGKLDQAIEVYRKALESTPDQQRVGSNLIYTMYYHPGIDDKAIHQEHLQWNARHVIPLRKLIQSHTNNRDPDRRLKVGYVSPDFYSHAESHFVLPLLEAHDHRQFEIHGYADVRRPDHITERLRRGVDVWHDVLGKSDADLAAQIRADQIDILVDLTMHMANNRLLVFAQKPAPVQVTWLAYPGSTGLDTIDYRLTDAFMDPPGVATPYFTEEAVRLPDCWCCYNPLSDAAPGAPRQDGPICFGSLNNPCKLNDPVLNLWGKVLEATPDSRLLILTFSVEHQKHMRQWYERMGIESQRLIFVRRSPREQYLRHYDRIDIGLDPLPYNGITTTLDALWMGVPVISLAGSTAAGRAGLGILTTLGMPELVAHSPEQLVQIASTLAGNLPRLAELRSMLRQRLQASPLMDASRFARNVEAAYREMWKKWCNE